MSTNLGLSEGYSETLEQIQPPTSLNELQKILGLCNYVWDCVPHYQKYAKILYADLKKKEPDPGRGVRQQWECVQCSRQISYQITHIKA